MHGDGVQSIALEVDDVPAAFEAAVARGAAPAPPPQKLEDEFGTYESPRSVPTATRLTRFVEPLAVSRASSRRVSSRSIPIGTVRARFTPSG